MRRHKWMLSDFVMPGVLPILAFATVIALIVNSIDSLVALHLGVSTDFHPLQPLFYAIFTVLGMIVGWVGWRVVEILGNNPRKLLMILVPVLTVLSFAPDTSLLLFPFIPETTLTGVVALMAMHLVVVGCLVPASILASRKFKS